MDVERQRSWGYWHRACRAAISHNPWPAYAVVVGHSTHRYIYPAANRIYPSANLLDIRGGL